MTETRMATTPRDAASVPQATLRAVSRRDIRGALSNRHEGAARMLRATPRTVQRLEQPQRTALGAPRGVPPRGNARFVWHPGPLPPGC